MSSRLRTQSVVVHAAKRTTVYPYKKNIKQGWRAGCGAPRYNLMYGILDVFFFLLKHTLAERRMSRKSSFAVVGRCFGSFASCARCSFLRFITSALKKQKKRCDWHAASCVKTELSNNMNPCDIALHFRCPRISSVFPTNAFLRWIFTSHWQTAHFPVEWRETLTKWRTKHRLKPVIVRHWTRHESATSRQSGNTRCYGRTFVTLNQPRCLQKTTFTVLRNVGV